MVCPTLIRLAASRRSTFSHKGRRDFLRLEVRLHVAFDGDRDVVAVAVFRAPDGNPQFDNALVIEGEALTSGEHTIEVRKRGRGPLYFNAYTTNFTLEEFITKCQNQYMEIFDEELLLVDGKLVPVE